MATILSPRAPTNVVVGELWADTVTLSWTASVSLAPVTKYVITAVAGTSTVTADVTTTSSFISGLKADTNYSITVTAKSDVGDCKFYLQPRQWGPL